MIPTAKFASMMPSFRAYSAACAKGKATVFNGTLYQSKVKEQTIKRHRFSTGMFVNSFVKSNCFVLIFENIIHYYRRN